MSIQISGGGGGTAISVCVGMSVDTPISANTVIKYDDVLENTGSCYDPSTGLLTAPSGGTYLFSPLCNIIDGDITLYINKNGANFAYILTHPGAGQCVGTCITISLVAGDTVGIYGDNSRTIRGKVGSPAYLNYLSIVKSGG